MLETEGQLRDRYSVTVGIIFSGGGRQNAVPDAGLL